MQTVFGEVTYPVMGMIKWHRTYFGMTASPLSVREVILGHLGVRAVPGRPHLRGVRAGDGAVRRLRARSTARCWPSSSQLLVALAFATPIYAFSAGLKDESAFAMVFRLGMIPLFLFSGAFFPIDNLDPWMRVARPGRRRCGTAST